MLNNRSAYYQITSGTGKVILSGKGWFLTDFIQTQDFLYRVPLVKIQNLKTLPSLKDYSIIKLSDKKNYLNIHKYGQNHRLINYGDRRIRQGNNDLKNILRDLVWILLVVLEYERELKGYFLAHASAIEFKGKSAVFFGQTHAGKTSVLSNLIFNYHCQALATEHVIFNGKSIDGGTQILQVKSTLKKYVRNIPIASEMGKVSWTDCDQYDIDLAKLNKFQIRAKVSLLVYVFVVHDSQKLEVYEWSERKTRVLLGEWLRWMINASQTYIYDCKGQFPSLDNLNFSFKRMKLINNLIKNGVRVYFMKGSSDNISQEVIKYLTK